MTEKYVQDQHFENVENYGSFWQSPGMHYENCTFSGCNFQKTALSGLKFFDCHFEDSDLSLTEVKETIFQNVAFKDCKMSGILFDSCNPFALEMHFRGCKLDHSSFYALKLDKTDFLYCSLKGVDFSSAQIKEAIFSGSDLLEAKFDQTNLEKADFRTAVNYVIHPQHNQMKGAIFSLDGLPGLLSAYKIKIVP